MGNVNKHRLVLVKCKKNKKKKFQKNLKKKPNSNYKTDKMTQTAKKDKNFVRKKLKNNTTLYIYIYENLPKFLLSLHSQYITS